MAEATLVDRRVRRTRRLLQEAVLALAEERDLGAITVQDITRHAGVNRATFYQHYRDRDALLDETFDALLAELTAKCGPMLDGIARLTPEEVPPSAVAMLREVRRRGGLYRRLLDPGGTSPFLARFQDYNERLFLQVWRHQRTSDDNGEAPPNVRARFAAAATASVIFWWLEHDQAESPEMIAAWLWRLSQSVWF